MRPIWDELRRQVDKARGDLPAEIIGPIVDDNFEDVFGIVVTLTGEGFSYAETKDRGRPSGGPSCCGSRMLPGSTSMAHRRSGFFVEYNNVRLAELGLSPFQLKQTLESANIIMPGGSITVGPERLTLEPTGNFESVEDLGRTVIMLPGGQEVVFLEDLAEVRRAYIDPPRSIMRSSGSPSLGLAISMRDGGNIIGLGEDVTALLDRLEGSYPIGVEFDIVAFEPGLVDQKVNEFVVNLFQAVAIVLVVLLVFLGIRTGSGCGEPGPDGHDHEPHGDGVLQYRTQSGLPRGAHHRAGNVG